jgi:hypothetical protein
VKLPPETVAGAKKIVTYWVRALCDERQTCTHDHSASSAADDGRSMIADLKLIDQLQRLECDDFAPTHPKPPVHGQEPSDERTPEERAARVLWLIRLSWRTHARWLGIEDAASSVYLGEESSDDPELAAPA